MLRLIRIHELKWIFLRNNEIKAICIDWCKDRESLPFQKMEEEGKWGPKKDEGGVKGECEAYPQATNGDMWVGDGGDLLQAHMFDPGVKVLAYENQLGWETCLVVDVPHKNSLNIYLDSLYVFLVKFDTVPKTFLAMLAMN
jgi:hypothetical protein